MFNDLVFMMPSMLYMYIYMYQFNSLSFVSHW